MILTKQNIKSINILSSEVIVLKKILNNEETHKIEEINKIYIKAKKIENFYFLDYLSLVFTISGFIAWEYEFYNIFNLAMLLLFFWTIYLINNRAYYVRIKFKNEVYYNYYFSKSLKYDIIEKVRIIRGIIVASNF